jgi:hypothetical protein
MGYQRVSKPSSGNSQIQKKESPSSVPAMPVQAKSDSASPRDQDMPNYTPLAANWATNNNLMRSLSGTQEIQRQEELGKEEMEPIQAKLTIGQVGDKYEQEADQMAQRVVSQINSPAPQQSTQGESLQREEMPEDEELQMKSASGSIQREERSEDEELQMKPEIQLKSDGGGMVATPDLEASIQQAKGGGQPLSESVRQPMEQAFGADFSGVNVHTDAHSDQLNQSIQAKAFTTGQDVFFRQGAYDPGSRGGQELIAHELTHVVQQGGAKVQSSGNSRIQKQDSPSTAPATPVPTQSVQGTVIQRKYKVIGMLKEGGLKKDMSSGGVPYMDAGGRAQYQVTVNNGLLFQNGNPLDTMHVSNKTYIFVMDENGQIFSAAKNVVHHHSAFMSGRPVAAAGTIMVMQGQLQSIDNQSGHYQPTKDYMDQFIKELKKRGVDLSNVEKDLGNTKKFYKKAFKKRGMAPRTRLYTPDLPKNKYY